MLFRSTCEVLNIVQDLEAKGAALTVLEPALSTKDAAGPILVTVLGMVAEMERKFIRERQQAGIEAGKAKGILKAANRPSRSRGCVRCGLLDMAPRPSRRPSASRG
jgi:DNA invertase Pin-like site-specific DNA recombinase